MSPTPRKPRSKSDDEPEKDTAPTPDPVTGREPREAPKRARRKAASKKEPAAEAAGTEKKATKAPRRRKAKADAPAQTEPVAEESTEAEVEAPEEAPAEESAPEPAKAQADAVVDEQPEAEAEAETPAPKPRRTRRAKPADPLAKAAPAPTPKRPPRDPNTGRPMVRAHAKYVRTSARKARLVCDHIRGKSVEEARAILAHANRDVARDWMKLLESAVANAEHNHELVGDELRIHAVKADEGPTLKRFRPRAMGRATQIRKRTSHLSITLTPKDGDY